jgi:Alginate lyase
VVKRIILIFGAILFCAGFRLSAGTVSLQPDEILQLRALVATNAAAAKQFSVILRSADAALGDKPDAIEKVTTEGRLDTDPAKIRTLAAVADMGKIESLAWAWAVTGDTNYSAKAHEFILAWAKVNRPDGDAINEMRFGPLIASYDLLRGTFSETDRRLVDDWLRDKATVLWKSSRGMTDNWFSHRLNVAGQIGWTIDDPALVAEVVKGFHAQINRNLKPDGATADFYLRDALHYHLYDIQPLVELSRVAERNGEHFFNYAATNGATLQRAVEFVVPFAEGEKTHIEFAQSKVAFDRQRAQNGQREFQPHNWRASEAIPLFSEVAWFRPEYGVIAAKLSGPPGENFFNWQVVVNAVSRH